jgi:hypothetical protein
MARSKTIWSCSWQSEQTNAVYCRPKVRQFMTLPGSAVCCVSTETTRVRMVGIRSLCIIAACTVHAGRAQVVSNQGAEILQVMGVVGNTLATWACGHTASADSFRPLSNIQC